MQDWPEDRQPNEELKKRIVESALCRSRRDQNSPVTWMTRLFSSLSETYYKTRSHNKTAQTRDEEWFAFLCLVSSCRRG